MGPGADLDDLRRRAEAATTAEEALEINTAILAIDPDHGAAMNRLGRAYQDLGYIDDAMAVFARAVAIDPKNAIAQRRLRDLERGRARLASPPPGTARNVVLREPAEALRLLEGAWRPACVGLLADLLLFARGLDSTRTIVRDLQPDYFYVAGGAHASAGPWRGLMDCYADSRLVEQDVIDRVVAAGGRHRPAAGYGVVPHSLRLEVPFDLIGELRPVLLPAMRDHIRVAIVHGPPQHMHLHNQALLEAILSEAAA